MLWCGTDLYQSICGIPEHCGVIPDHGRATDAYRAMHISLVIEDRQLFLDEIQIDAVGERYLSIADRLPEFPPGRSKGADYRNLKLPVVNSGVLVLLKNQVTFRNCVSGWFTPSDFSEVRELEFVAGRLLEPANDPNELLGQRNRMALRVLDPITRSNWKTLELFLRHDVIVGLHPEAVRENLQGVPLIESLNRYPSWRKPAWSENQIELVAEAAEGAVREEMAFELLGVLEDTSERFVEAMSSPQVGLSEPTARTEALTLMTSDPDLSRTRFLSAEVPAMHDLIKFSDIEKTVPEGPGIYQIWHICWGVLKVGISANLRHRLQKHRASRDSALKLKPGGTPDNPDDWVSKASILAKHLYFDGGLVTKSDLTTEAGRRRFLEEECEITFYGTASKEEARELEKTLEGSGKVRYQGKVKVY